MDKADAGHVIFFEKFFKKVNYFEKWLYIKRVKILVYIKKCIVNQYRWGNTTALAPPTNYLMFPYISKHIMFSWKKRPVSLAGLFDCL